MLVHVKPACSRWVGEWVVEGDEKQMVVVVVVVVSRNVNDGG